MSNFHSITPYGSKVCHGSVTGVTCDTTVAGCDNILMCADQGFPTGHKDIEQYALKIAHISHPDLAALSPSWVDQFIA